MKRALAVAPPFDLDECLYMAQDFRWCKIGDGWHSGVLRGNLIHIRQNDRGVEYRAHSDLSELLTSYFRLDEDIHAVYEHISSIDDRVACLVRKYPGLRVLRQPDPWECTVAYICSATNNIDRIRNIVEKIAKGIGKPVELDGEVRHAFPTVEEILYAGERQLEELSLGLNRHKKIIAAAERIHSGQLDLCRLAQPDVTYGEAKVQLTACYGIGPKVADCIALFTLGKTQAFPVDTWVRRAVAEYFPGLELYDEAIAQWAQDRFGKYAGYANQFLFTGQFMQAAEQRVPRKSLASKSRPSLTIAGLPRSQASPTGSC